MIRGINHIGVAVHDLDRAVEFFQNVYGAQLIWRKVFEGQKSESAFLRIGEDQFEVSMSIDADGVIAKFIEQRGEGIHHISMEVNDIRSTIKKLKNKGMTLISETHTDEFSIVFVHPKCNLGILIELIDRKDNK